MALNKQEVAIKDLDKAVAIIKKAAIIVRGDRQKEYGNKRENFQNTANLWNAYLTAHSITPHDVAMMMILLKMARTMTGSAKTNEDTYVDMAGYAGIAGVLR